MIFSDGAILFNRHSLVLSLCEGVEAVKKSLIVTDDWFGN